MNTNGRSTDAGPQRECLHCGGTAASPLEHLGGGYRLVRCGRCRLVYWPFWDDGFDDSHEEFYGRHVRSFEPDPLNLDRIASVLEALGRGRRGRRLLDVGCGLGEFIRVGAANGWDAWGVDLSETAIAACVSQGLHCTTTDFFDIAPAEHRFDVVVMSEIIEHVPHPVTWLRHARSLLADRGVVYLTTPNFDSLGCRSLQGEWAAITPGHISYFTPATLTSVAEEAGLRVASLATRNASMAGLRRLVRPGGTAAPDRDDQYRQQQAARVRIESSRRLQAVKQAINLVLSLTRLGETIVVELVADEARPAGRSAPA